MQKKKTMMVDMDDVITSGRFMDYVNEYYGYEVDTSKVDTYYFQDALFGDKKADFFEFLKEKNLYLDAELFPDCYDVLKDLNDRYQILVCTDYIWKEMISSAGSNLKNKYDYLYERLDFLNPRDFVFTANKSVINCDIKLDDKPVNLEGASTKLLFTAWHNKKMTKEELDKEEIIRVDNWKDVHKVLTLTNKPR